MEKEIIEGNILIAEFDDNMELYQPPNPNYEPYWRRNGMEVSPKNMKYHISWDWIKPVVDKIYNETSEHDQTFSGNVIFELGICAGINDVYEGVIQFIQWYNQNKKPNE